MRDPAAYVKRADLATPKLIDHDYNYLTSLEREIDKADRDATERGFVLAEAARDGRANKGIQRKGEVPLKEAFERCEVIVARAPKGMSRAKANNTHWARKKQRVVWTVEWVHPDGRKEEWECAEDRAIGEVYEEACRPKEEYRPRKRRKNAKERLRIAVKGGGLPQNGALSESIPENSSESLPQEETLAELRTERVTENTQTDPASSNAVSGETGPAPTLSVQTVTDTIASSLPTSTDLGDGQIALLPESNLQEEPSITLHHSPPFTFYLHSPSLPSQRLVLIPLHHSATLASILRGRLVLEFPTIYVFKTDDQVPDGGTKVPIGFISEEEFFAQAKRLLVEEVEEGEIDEGQEDTGGNEEKNGSDRHRKDFDAEHVLKMLGEDLKSLD